MSRKTRAFRVFLHQNQNPTIKQTWDTAWKRAQKIFHARSMQDMEEKLAAAQAECERMRKDAERYRWLREECKNPIGGLTIASVTEWGLEGWSGDDPDNRIDAAMSKEDRGYD